MQAPTPPPPPPPGRESNPPPPPPPQRMSLAGFMSGKRDGPEKQMSSGKPGFKVATKFNPRDVLNLQKEDGSWQFNDDLCDALRCETEDAEKGLAAAKKAAPGLSNADLKALWGTHLVLYRLRAELDLWFGPSPPPGNTTYKFWLGKVNDDLTWEEKGKAFTSQRASTQVALQSVAKHYYVSRHGHQKICPTCGKEFLPSAEHPGCPDCLARKAKEGVYRLGHHSSSSSFELSVGKAVPHSDLDNIDWDMVGWHHIPGGLGSVGVFLVQLKSGGCVILKPGTSGAALAVLSSQFTQAMGIKVPAIRIIRDSDSCYEAIMTGMHDKPSTNDPDHYRGKHALHNQFIMVMEFCKGHDLAYERSLSDGVLQQLGSLAALDTIFNNFDRLPLIWANDGNLGNALVSPDNKIIAIDQTLSPITQPAGLNTYIFKVRAAVEDLFSPSAKTSTPATMTRLLKVFSSDLGITLSQSQINAFVDGTRAMFTKLAHDTNSARLLTQAADRARQLFRDARADVGLMHVDESVMFMNRVVEAVKDAVDSVEGK